MAQNTAQENTDGVMTAPLSPAFLARLNGLPLEVKTMILSIMAAQDVEQLQAIRGSCKFQNLGILAHQFDIVRSIVASNECLYHTASRLFYGLYQPVDPDLKYLFKIARKIDIAKQLAKVLAAQLQKRQNSDSSNSQFPRNCFDEASYGRFVRNVVPYILALDHFLECYRDGLASYVPDPRHANSLWSLSVRVRFSILSTSYNQETVYRICSLYQILRHILDRELGSQYHNGRNIMMSSLLHIRRTAYSDCMDIFTFGGLEAVKDAMEQRTRERRLSVLEDHFARACPDHFTRHHALPPPTLSKVDRATTERICRLLPLGSKFSFLYLQTFRGGGFPREGCSKEQELNRFYEHLVTYEGDEPELIL